MKETVASQNVLETFTEDLPVNVSKIQSITEEHTSILHSDFISSKLNKKKMSSNSGNDFAIYHFKNDYKAVLAYDGHAVYAIVKNSEGKKVEKIIADFTQLDSRNTVVVNYLLSGKSQTITVGNKNENYLKAAESWGSCMDDAVDQLYDDWEEAPVGTFSCWVTGPLCVIGGGIACGIQQI